MICETVGFINEHLSNTSPTLVGIGTTHSIYKIGDYACKIQTLEDSPDSKLLFEIEAHCCGLLLKNNIDCVKAYGVVDGNLLKNVIFKGKYVLVEEYINGPTMFENSRDINEDFKRLYSIINDINKIEAPYFGWYKSKVFGSWNEFMSDLRDQIGNYLKSNFPKVYENYKLIKFTSSYNGIPRILLLEFNPHNFVFRNNSFKAIDVNSLLCGDPLYQWSRIKMHMELHNRNHFCDEFLKRVDTDTVTKYMILSCGHDLLTRCKVGLSIDAHQKKLVELICSLGGCEYE